MWPGPQRLFNPSFWFASKTFLIRRGETRLEFSQSASDRSASRRISLMVGLALLVALVMLTGLLPAQAVAKAKKAFGAAIAWNGFDNFYFLFSYEDSKKRLMLPYNLKILKKVSSLGRKATPMKTSFGPPTTSKTWSRTARRTKKPSWKRA